MTAESDAIDQVVLAIDGFLRRSTVPILAKDQGQTVQRGTGSLFAVNGRYYLITAAHVVTGIDLNLVGVALTQPDIWVLGPSTQFTLDEEADIAAISLDDDLVARVADVSRFFGVEHLGRIRGNERGFVVAGYAHATTRTLGKTLIRDFNTIIASRYSGEFDFIMEDPVDPERDLFLQHTRLAATLQDRQEPTPHLGGISGASVWAVLADGPPAPVWTVRDRIRLVAIETAVRQGAYIRATKWLAAAEVIRQVDSIGAAQIIEAIEG